LFFISGIGLSLISWNNGYESIVELLLTPLAMPVTVYAVYLFVRYIRFGSIN